MPKIKIFLTYYNTCTVVIQNRVKNNLEIKPEKKKMIPYDDVLQQTESTGCHNTFYQL